MLIVLAACAPADGPEAGAAVAGTDRPLPSAVAAAVEEYLGICREIGGQPDLADGVRQADLNADGITDYVLNGHNIFCQGAATAWGDRAKLVQVFAGDGKGDAVLAFTGLTWGVTFEGEGKDAQIWVGSAGEDCGQPTAASFSQEKFCDRRILWSATTGKFEYAPVSTVRMLN